METVVGIFHSRDDAERGVQQLLALGVPANRIGLLTPGTRGQSVHRVPVEDAEPPGIGKALGATVGGALGVAGGATAGAALASLLVPGVGPVIAGGLIGAAILGAGGTATGLVAGEKLEESLTEGLPRDEVFLYEDALRKGHSVVIGLTEDADSAENTRLALSQVGAETVDAAKESWWLGLRDAEQLHYKEAGGDFRADEVSYRRGFEAALHPERRGRGFNERQKELADSFGQVSSTKAFQQGYDRGQSHQKKIMEKNKG
jgi:hypothetical protein